MKFIIEKEMLQKGLTKSRKAISVGKTNIPSLDGFLLKAEKDNDGGGTLTIVGSDSNITICSTVDAEVLEIGEIIVEAKIFSEIVTKLPAGVIEVSVSDNTMSIVCEKSSFSISVLNGNDYPNLPNAKENMSLEISQSELKHMVQGVSSAVSEDDSRPILQGIYLESSGGTLNIVALDGYRLSLRKTSVEGNPMKVVVNGKNLIEIAKMLDDTDNTVKLSFDENHLTIQLEHTIVYSRLMQGEYIQYKSLIPQEFKTELTVNKDAFRECIERASIMGGSINSIIRLDITSGVINISSKCQQGRVNEEIKIQTSKSDEPLTIGFNAKYILSALKSIDGPDVIINLNSGVAPCVLKNTDNSGNDCYLVLPVRMAH